MKAVIAGATGLVGSILIQKLLTNPSFTQVVSVARRPLPIQNPELSQVIIPDFSKLADPSEKLKGDVYFCCLGTTIKIAGSQENFRKVDFDAIVEFGRVAKANSAQSFVLVSAMGANAKSAIFYNKVKGETEEAIMALNLRSLSIFRPGLLLGERSESRAGENFATAVFKVLSPILPERLEKTIATKADHLADRMLNLGITAKPGTEIIDPADI